MGGREGGAKEIIRSRERAEEKGGREGGREGGRKKARLRGSLFVTRVSMAMQVGNISVNEDRENILPQQTREKTNKQTHYTHMHTYTHTVT